MMENTGNRFGRGLSVLMILALVIAPITGCSSMGDTGEAREVFDPLEPLNRYVHAANEAVDVLALGPLSTIYNGLVPEIARDAAGNFLRNLNSPLVIANQALQGDWEGTKTASIRFVMNSTVGLAGLVDVAADHGYEYEHEDLGQTLAVWGLPEGPYIVLPLLGPSNLRDTVGIVGEAMADPLNIYLHNTKEERWAWYRAGAEGFTARAEADSAIKDLRANSVDHYAAMRSAYHQRREAMIADGEAEDIDFPIYQDMQSPESGEGAPLVQLDREQVSQAPEMARDMAVSRAIYRYYR